jgi:hypothetical protein
MRREDLPILAWALAPLVALGLLFWFLTGSPSTLIMVALAIAGFAFGLYLGRRWP